MASRSRAAGVGVVTIRRFLGDACARFMLATRSRVIPMRRNGAAGLLATLNARK